MACNLIEQFEEGAEGKKAWEALTDKFEGTGSLAAGRGFGKEAHDLGTMEDSIDPDMFFVEG